MVGGISYTQVGLARPTDRLVQAGDGGFKAAGSGSLGNRIVNAFKEAFFPGTVRAENRQAYQAVRAEWGRQHGNESQAVREFFDARIAGGDRFDAPARDRLLGLPALSYDLASAGEETRGIVEKFLEGLESDAAAAVNERVPVPDHPGVTLSGNFLADAGRHMTVMLDDGPLTIGGLLGGSGSPMPSPTREGNQANAAALGNRLVEAFGAEWTPTLTNYVQQGLAAVGNAYAQIGLSELDPKGHPDFQSPFRLPDGEPIDVTGFKPNYAIHLSRNEAGGIHIRCDVGFNVGAKRAEEAEMSKTGDQTPVVANHSDASSLLMSYGFDLAKNEETGRIETRNATPISFASHFRRRDAS